MTYNPVQRSASKHIDLADHYAREQQELGVITISYVSTKGLWTQLIHIFKISLQTFLLWVTFKFCTMNLLLAMKFPPRHI